VQTDRLLSSFAGPLSTALASLGAQAWLVGGTVRDLELERPSVDVDVVVSAGQDSQGASLTALETARAVAGRVAAATERPWFALSSEFGAFRVVGAFVNLDLTALRGGSIQADLSLRDFTMNAMALPLSGQGMVDPFEGLRHLREGRLVAVSDEVFRADPLRLMRAVRLAHTLGVALDAPLVRRIREDAPLLPAAAAERVFSEVVLTLGSGRSSTAVRLWDDLGLLPFFLPEVPLLHGVTQSDYHHLDVFGHTLETMDHVDAMIARPEVIFRSAAEELGFRLDEPVDGAVPRPVALRLAALLHDVAKPETRTVREDGRVCFMRHTELGGPQSEAICRRLHTSGTLARLVRRVVEHHLTLGFLLHQEPLPARAIVEYLWAAAPWEPEVILVSAADRLATRGRSTPESYLQRHVALAAELMAAWSARQRLGVSPCPVDGRLLQARLGLGPGPELGEVLREVRLAWEAGEVREADALVEHAAAFRTRARTHPLNEGPSMAPETGPAAE
jgi:poly(A) polymerase